MELNLGLNKLGENSESLKLVVEGIKQLPSNLRSLKLELSLNILGENSENFKLLTEGMK